MSGTLSFVIGHDNTKSGLWIEKTRLTLEPKAFIESLSEDERLSLTSILLSDATKTIAASDDETRSALLVALAEVMAGDDFIDALDIKHERDDGAQRGLILLDLFVRRAIELDRIPDDWQPEWVDDFENDAERLQSMIVDGRTDDALQLLHDMAPETAFLSPKAEKMLAEIHGRKQESLPL